jgi:hypothetical protein
VTTVVLVIATYCVLSVLLTLVLGRWLRRQAA